MTAPDRPAPEKREQILEATIRVLNERGLSGLKVEDVARAAEVGKGTVYLYFADKQALLKALVEQRTRQFYADAGAITTGPGNFEDRLRHLVRSRFGFIEEWRGLWSAVAQEASSERDWLVRLHETYQGLLEGFVGRAVTTQELPEQDVGLSASVLSTLGYPQLPVEREAYLEHLCSILLAGLRQGAREPAVHPPLEGSLRGPLGEGWAGEAEGG